MNPFASPPPSIVSRSRWALPLLTLALWRAVASPPSATPTAQPNSDVGHRFLLSSEGSGRATGYSESNKIVTLGHHTHVTWLDATADGFRIRIRTLDRTTGRWGPVTEVGEGQDNHASPALTCDSQGYLHILYYPHHQPFRYRRSLRPNDSSAWGPEIQFGERLSYPVVVVAPDDTLILTGRRSSQTDDERYQVELWKKPPGQDWRRRLVLLRSRTPRYAHFQESLAWGPDGNTLHLSCRIYESNPKKDEAPFQTVGYLVSPDRGETWQRSDGTPVALPATADTVDILQRGGGTSGRTLYVGAIGVSPAGVPHLVYNERLSLSGNHSDALPASSPPPSAATEKPSSAGPTYARTYLCTPQPGGGWSKRDLRGALPAAWRDYDLGVTSGLTFSASGRATIVSSIVKLAPGEEDWGHPSNEIARLWSDDGAATFQGEVLLPADPKVPHWLPNLERPTGHHRIPDEPGIVFTAGSAGAGLHDLVLNNQVWWQTRN